MTTTTAPGTTKSSALNNENAPTPSCDVGRGVFSDGEWSFKGIVDIDAEHSPYRVEMVRFTSPFRERCSSPLVARH